MTRPPATRRRPAKLPWRDRAGRLAPFKLAVFLALFVPGIVLAGEFALGMLGARPLNAAIHGIGLWAIRLLLLALAVTPARAVFDWPRLPLVRRMLGVGALAYGLIHLSLYAIDQNGHMLHVAAEIIHRFYLTIGFTALVGLAALGITSTDASVRRMGRNWQRLHWLAYPIGVLAVFHATLQSKIDVSEAMVMAGCFVWLMLWRLLPAERQRSPLALLPLAALASGATAALEYAWYALATRIPAERVLAANLDFEDGLRPAVWVLITAVCIAVVATARNQRRSAVRPA
jgi:sulfoxide reductase heme-binding subunit YedZ